jgi:hypothetical protein
MAGRVYAGRWRALLRRCRRSGGARQVRHVEKGQSVRNAPPPPI